MKIGGNSSFLFFALTSMVCMCSAIFFKRHDDEDRPSLLLKPLKIFSRPNPHGDKNSAPGLIPHLGNVLQGGSIGIEITPFGLAHGILGHAKKVIPGSKDTWGQPSYEEPPQKDHYDERRDWEFEKPKMEVNKDWEPEEEKPKHHVPEKPEHHIPERPKQHIPEKPVVPSWDEIGENPDDESTGVDIIQPRLRPKRFIESKIYHVPLLYRSNGRPYQVKIKSRNDLDESKAESD